MASYRPIVHIIGNPIRFSEQAETAAYRIIQESLNNVFKHANASKVDVSIMFSDDFVEVSVVDDGKGFVIRNESSLEVRHAGLIGMRERARSVGGHLQIDSSKDRGTRIVAHIPKEYSKTESASIVRQQLGS